MVFMIKLRGKKRVQRKCAFIFKWGKIIEKETWKRQKFDLERVPAYNKSEIEKDGCF